MNELDSEIMVGQLVSRGLTQTQDENTADLLLFNTCSIRDLRRDEKPWENLGGRKKPRTTRLLVSPDAWPTQKKTRSSRKSPISTSSSAPTTSTTYNNILDEVLAGGSKPSAPTTTSNSNSTTSTPREMTKSKPTCRLFAAATNSAPTALSPTPADPKFRGIPTRSLKNAAILVDQGYKEITLLGQNVNSYGKDKPDGTPFFHDLLYRIDGIAGLERVRFMTSHPVDITRDLMLAIRDLRTLCEFVHFPLQAGSNRILKKMHRIYTVEEYLGKVSELRSLVPEVSLGTDIIVGFPTETEEEFQETYDRLKELEFSTAFLFSYSQRKGTPAMRWKDDVPENVKEDRLKRLLVLQEGISAKHRQAMLGKTVEVLVEKQNDKDQDLVKGRTRCLEKRPFPWRCAYRHPPERHHP